MGLIQVGRVHGSRCSLPPHRSPWTAATGRQQPIDIAAVIREQDQQQYERDQAAYRRTHSGRAGTGSREVTAWWPDIEAALEEGHTRKRIWETLRGLTAAQRGDRPPITVGYETFNKHVAHRRDDKSRHTTPSVAIERQTADTSTPSVTETNRERHRGQGETPRSVLDQIQKKARRPRE